MCSAMHIDYNACCTLIELKKPIQRTFERVVDLVMVSTHAEAEHTPTEYGAAVEVALLTLSFEYRTTANSNPVSFPQDICF